MIVSGNAQEAQDMWLAKETGEYLESLYPGWQWAVGVIGGVVIIQSIVITHLLHEARVKNAASYKEVLHYKDIISDANHRKRQVMRAGGNLLERAKKARGGREWGDFTPIKDFDTSLGGLRS